MPRKRKRDQDGLYTRPDSSYWWASFSKRDGRTARRSTGIPVEEPDSRARAQAIRAQWVVEALDGRLSQPSDRHTFDELMLLYLKSVSPHKKSNRDQYSAKKLYPFFTGQDLEGIRAAEARSYIAQRQEDGASPGTINKEIGLMSAALNWARKELEWEVPNPFQARRLKEPAGRNRWLSQTEASKLIQAAENARRSPHLADFIRLGLNTGMRPGELLKLSWSRVDLEMGLIYLEADDQKNGKLGSVPLNREARAVIDTRNRWREKYCPLTDWVFCDRKGQRIGSIKKSFRSAVERAGLSNVHPHDLRRTCGSWLVQKGVDIRTVSELLRHSDVRITAEVYAHLSPANLRSAVDVLDG